jgi:hypothetical protein
MRINTLLLTVSLALFFLALPQIARAQKDGEAQAVIFDANNRPTLIFRNKSDKKKTCGAFVSYTLMGNQEEAIALEVTHLHLGRLGAPNSLKEIGWLYMTPTRIVFRVREGDKAHAFDLPRTALKDKPVSRLNRFKTIYIGIQINLKEKLAASDSSGQKFVFFSVRARGCKGLDPEPYSKFIERAVEDFNAAMAEFKQVVASLKESSKIEQDPTRERPLILPGEGGLMPVPSDATIGPSYTPAPRPRFGTGLGLTSSNTGVDITSEPDGAEIYADGKFFSTTPMGIALSAGKHTIRVTKPGYKDWEQKIIVEQGSLKKYNIVLEKQ